MSADTKLVKTPHQQENYTPDQLIELAKFKSACDET